MIGARQIMDRNRAELIDRTDGPTVNTTILTGKVDATPVEIMVDADGRIRRGSCGCNYYRKFNLKAGPCRHMLALRWRSSVSAMQAHAVTGWYNRLTGRG